MQNFGLLSFFVFLKTKILLKKINYYNFLYIKKKLNLSLS